MSNPTKIATSTVCPGLRYRDAQAAIDWLCKIFGFEQKALYKNEDGTIGHAELTLGGGMVMLSSMKNDEHAQRYRAPDEVGGIETSGIYLVIADIDAAHARAVAAGATITRPLNQTDYGSRDFAVKDPEGHTWSAGTYDPWAAHE